MARLISVSDFKWISPDFFSQTYILGSNISENPELFIRKGRDRNNGNKVTLKVFPKVLVSQLNKERNLLYEVSSLLLLDNPYICRLIDYFQDTSNFYIVTERFSDKDLLLQLISSQDHSESTCKIYLEQIFSILVALEQQNIVHRNIKLENFVFVSNSFKLINFNCSVILNPSEKITGKIGTPYYMAPEVINGAYDTKADMWSAGVIFYFILSGKFPFDGHTTDKILTAVESGSYNFEGSFWKRISDSAKDLIRKIFVNDPSRRISPAEALEHQWFRDLHHELPAADLAKPVICNLISFKAKEHFKKAVLRYAATLYMADAHKDELLEFFMGLDSNKDGCLSKNELKEGFVKIFGNRIRNPENEAEKIISEADLDSSGDISYTEFVLAAMNRNKLTERCKLEEIFAKIDSDHNGSISASELRQAFSRNFIDNKTLSIEEMIRECDSNCDGCIDLAEFTSFMLKN